MLGYGYSTMTEEAKFTFDDLVQGIRRFASALGIEACGLVGNSMGGAVCIQLALEDPDFVKKLVLMAPGGMEETEVYMKMKGIRTMIKVQYSGEGITREGMRKIFSLQVHDPELVTDRIIEERYQIAIKQPKGMFEKMRVPNLSSRGWRDSVSDPGVLGHERRVLPAVGRDDDRRELQQHEDDVADGVRALGDGRTSRLLQRAVRGVLHRRLTVAGQ